MRMEVRDSWVGRQGCKNGDGEELGRETGV